MDATHLSLLTPHKLFTSLIIHEFAIALQKRGADDEGAAADDDDDDDDGDDEDECDVRMLSFALADELLQARPRPRTLFYSNRCLHLSRCDGLISCVPMCKRRVLLLLSAFACANVTCIASSDARVVFRAAARRTRRLVARRVRFAAIRACCRTRAATIPRH